MSGKEMPLSAYLNGFPDLASGHPFSLLKDVLPISLSAESAASWQVSLMRSWLEKTCDGESVRAQFFRGLRNNIGWENAKLFINDKNPPQAVQDVVLVFPLTGEEKRALVIRSQLANDIRVTDIFTDSESFITEPGQRATEVDLAEPEKVWFRHTNEIDGQEIGATVELQGFDQPHYTTRTVIQQNELQNKATAEKQKANVSREVNYNTQGAIESHTLIFNVDDGLFKLKFNEHIDHHNPEHSTSEIKTHGVGAKNVHVTRSSEQNEGLEAAVGFGPVIGDDTPKQDLASCVISGDSLSKIIETIAHNSKSVLSIEGDISEFLAYVVTRIRKQTQDINCTVGFNFLPFRSI